jgi:protein-L-isoaspartate(D-aspartate) O-methyltransferase
MIDKLQTAGIAQNVLQAMLTVPRHFFMDSMLARDAYELQALPLSQISTATPDENQTISHPLTVARQTQLLDVHPNDKILEIGTGSGYQTAVLCAMGAEVFSIERQQALYEFASNILSKMNYRPMLVFGDGFEGLPQYAPYNKIIVTCGAEAVPPKLQTQMAVGGRMVIPIRHKDGHYLISVDKINSTEYKTTNYGRCRNFVPMLAATNAA